jgi:hypothetical protein
LAEPDSNRSTIFALCTSGDALSHYRQSERVKSEFVGQSTLEHHEPPFLASVGERLPLFQISILRFVTDKLLIGADRALDKGARRGSEK